MRGALSASPTHLGDSTQVTKALETPLSRAILNNELQPGDVATFLVKNERLTLEIRRPGQDDMDARPEPMPDAPALAGAGGKTRKSD